MHGIRMRNRTRMKTETPIPNLQYSVLSTQ